MQLCKKSKRTRPRGLVHAQACKLLGEQLQAWSLVPKDEQSVGGPKDASSSRHGMHSKHKGGGEKTWAKTLFVGKYDAVSVKN